MCSKRLISQYTPEEINPLLVAFEISRGAWEVDVLPECVNRSVDRCRHVGSTVQVKYCDPLKALDDPT
jgi:hypothetical protein